jgi:hypothetical protein
VIDPGQFKARTIILYRQQETVIGHRTRNFQPGVLGVQFDSKKLSKRSHFNPYFLTKLPTIDFSGKTKMPFIILAHFC